MPRTDCILSEEQIIATENDAFSYIYCSVHNVNTLLQDEHIPIASCDCRNIMRVNRTTGDSHDHHSSSTDIHASDITSTPTIHTTDGTLGAVYSTSAAGPSTGGAQQQSSLSDDAEEDEHSSASSNVSNPPLTDVMRISSMRDREHTMLNILHTVE